LRYGDYVDLSAQTVEVTTYFSRHVDDTVSAAFELGRAEHQDLQRLRGERYITDPGDSPDGPFGHRAAEIVIDGQPHVIDVMEYDKYRALQCQCNDTIINVVSRNYSLDHLALVRISDLRPYVTGENLDRDAIRDWLAGKDQGRA
jgi:hypothetical protein